MLGGAALAIAGAPPAGARPPGAPASQGASAHAAQAPASTTGAASEVTTTTTSPVALASTSATSVSSATPSTTTTFSSPTLTAPSMSTTSTSASASAPAPVAGPVAPAGPGAANAAAASGATGPAAGASAATTADDGTLFSSGATQAGGASAPSSAAVSGGTEAPTAGGTIAAAASGVAAAISTAALPPLPFTGVLALNDPFASVADSVLGYFRIPLFLLPIYQAAGDQYGVPWPVLAAINEIETDYGHDLNVSAAGALGWMQFLPTTWIEYGVDATASGVADPYNPADAIFAAARVLRDAGSRANLAGAIFAYNHSTAYVASVLLRARLIDDYPPSLIDSLTELSIGQTPVHNADVRSVDYGSGSSSITVAAPRPVAGKASPQLHRSVRIQLPAPLTLITTPGARVLAVRDARVVHEGTSPTLGGEYLTLRDADGNYFTYGHLSRRAVYGPEHPPRWHPLGVGAAVSAGAVIGEVGGTDSIGMLRFAVRPAGDGEPVDPLPYLDSWALRTETLEPAGPAVGRTVSAPAGAGAPPSTTAVGQPSAPALAPSTGVLAGGATGAAGVPASTGAGSDAGPTGSPASPPAGGLATATTTRARLALIASARAATDLFTWGSTGIFFATTGSLEHAVLSDRHVTLPACERRSVAAHRIDRRVLAVLEYLSQSGFSLTVNPSSCGVLPVGNVAHPPRIASMDVSAVNGAAIPARPSAVSLTGLVLARLRALYGEFVPESILDVASAAHVVAGGQGAPHELRVSFAVAGSVLAKPPAPAQAAAARVPALDEPLTTLEWSQVTARLSAIRSPRLVVFPSPNATAARR